MAAIEASDLREGPTAPVWRLLGDDALARAAGRGNDHAFAALYARHSGPLRGYCASILLNSEDAEDAVQATMLKAMRALPARRPGLPLRPWLYRIAHNEAVDALRRRRFHKDVEEEITPALISPGPDVDLARRERLSELVRDLRTLPERQRAALLMRELSGLSYDEIAGALEVTPGAVRQLVFEARSSMHEFARGRDTACVTVQRSLSDCDGRRRRARSVRAHLRSCTACRAFGLAIGRREEDLAALPPLVLEGTAALAVAAGGVLGIGLAGGGSVTALVGGTAAKGIATAALAIALGTGAAMETGVAPIGAGAGQAAEHRAARPGVPRAAIASTTLKGNPSVRRAAARVTDPARPPRKRRTAPARTRATVDRAATRVHVPSVHVAAPTTIDVGPKPAAGSQPQTQPEAPRPAAPQRPTAQAVTDWSREGATQIAQQATQRAMDAARAAMAGRQTFVQRTLNSTRQTLTTIQQQTTQTLSDVQRLVERLLQGR